MGCALGEWEKLPLHPTRTGLAGLLAPELLIRGLHACKNKARRIVRAQENSQHIVRTNLYSSIWWKRKSLTKEQEPGTSLRSVLVHFNLRYIHGTFTIAALDTRVELFGLMIQPTTKKMPAKKKCRLICWGCNACHERQNLAHVGNAAEKPDS